MRRFFRNSALTLVVTSLCACVPHTQRRLHEGPETSRPFAPAARTVGGPGLVVRDNCAPKFDDSPYHRVDGSESIFEDMNHTRANSGRNPRSVCATIENLGSTMLAVSILDDLRTLPSGMNTWIVERSGAVAPGQTKTFCERAADIRVTCELGCEGVACHKFRWRVDMHAP